MVGEEVLDEGDEERVGERVEKDVGKDNGEDVEDTSSQGGQNQHQHHPFFHSGHAGFQHFTFRF